MSLMKRLLVCLGIAFCSLQQCFSTSLVKRNPWHMLTLLMEP